uniref:Uncharacterized protein n=1 Tax=Anopheles braziliensis TaxID=58242 RepID=A0A2M3ZLU3_9DIPT
MMLFWTLFQEFSFLFLLCFLSFLVSLFDFSPRLAHPRFIIMCTLLSTSSLFSLSLYCFFFSFGRAGDGHGMPKIDYLTTTTKPILKLLKGRGKGGQQSSIDHFICLDHL